MYKSVMNIMRVNFMLKISLKNCDHFGNWKFILENEVEVENLKKNQKKVYSFLNIPYF